MTIPVPESVTALAGHLRKDLAATVEVAHAGDNRWRLTASTDRARVWVEYAAYSHGRLRWRASERYRDGQLIDNASSYDELVEFFRDPDGLHDGQPTVEPVEVDPARAPDMVRLSYDKLMSSPAARVRGAEVVIYTSGRRWSVVMDMGTAQIGVHFTQVWVDTSRPLREPQVHMDSQPITLFIDGIDRTAQVQGRLDRALGLIQGYQSAPKDPAVNSASPAAVQDSVRVRRQSVIRV